MLHAFLRSNRLTHTFSNVSELVSQNSESMETPLKVFGSHCNDNPTIMPIEESHTTCFDHAFQHHNILNTLFNCPGQDVLMQRYREIIYQAHFPKMDFGSKYLSVELTFQKSLTMTSAPIVNEVSAAIALEKLA